MRTAIILCLTGLTGCKKIPPAPTELEELASYLFDHLDDEEPDELANGMANLDAWLENNFEEATEGYRVDNLPLEYVEDLTTPPENLDGQIGAAVTYELAYSMDDVMRVSLDTDPREVNPDMYLDYSVEWDGDLDCYLARECEMISSISRMVTNLPLGVEITTHTQYQYRWVETDSGTHHVRRSWMIEPASVNVDWVTVHQQYFLAAIFELDASTTRRLDSGWALMEILDAPIPEDLGVKLAVDSMRDSGTAIEDYLGR